MFLRMCFFFFLYIHLTTKYSLCCFSETTSADYLINIYCVIISLTISYRYRWDFKPLRPAWFSMPFYIFKQWSAICRKIAFFTFVVIYIMVSARSLWPRPNKFFFRTQALAGMICQLGLTISGYSQQRLLESLAHFLSVCSYCTFGQMYSLRY